mmetsp:Transcript_2810/g.6001  ORF Transcript_2810/g.6001 Transcript_2810/m.6001 type:complete len:358 (-) Transcript_2810:42-1115(-)
MRALSSISHPRPRRSKMAPLLLLCVCSLFSFAIIIHQYHALGSLRVKNAQHTGEEAMSTTTATTAICNNLNMLTSGSWNNVTKQWHPFNCSFTPFDKPRVDNCLSNKQIGFYGDSTLRNIAHELINLDKANITLAAWASSAKRYICGAGQIGSNGSSLAMYWTPSAFYQKPALMKSIGTDDVSIISISVWDMGTYYRGVNPWFVAMKKIILEAAKKRRNKPLYVMNLHNIYASKCTLKNDNDQGRKALKLCQECNKMDAMFAFRDAIASAVRCVKEDGYHNVYLIDTFGVTNSSFGEEHSDGVHFSSEVTQVELQVLLSAICNSSFQHDLNETLLSRGTCPSQPNFEEGRELGCKQY